MAADKAAYNNTTAQLGALGSTPVSRRAFATSRRRLFQELARCMTGPATLTMLP